MNRIAQTMSLSSAADCYIRMEQEYRRSITAILQARTAAREQLKHCRRNIGGTLQSAWQQKQLEREIEILTDEYYCLCDALRSISIYARHQEQEGA